MRLFLISTVVAVLSIIAGGILLGSSDFSQVNQKFKFLQNFDVQIDERDDGANISVKVKPNEEGKSRLTYTDEDGAVSEVTDFEMSFNKKNKNTAKYELSLSDKDFNTVHISGISTDIEISGESDTKDIVVELKCKPAYFEQCKNLISTKDTGVLSIDIKNEPKLKKIRNFIESVEIQIPKASVKDIQLHVGAGNIEIEDVLLKKVELNLGAGNISVEEVTVDILDIKNGAGRISVEDSEIKQHSNIKNGAGDISIKTLNSDPNVIAHSGTGSLKFEVKPKDKNFKLLAKTGMGSLDLPEKFKQENGYKIYGSGKGTVELKTGVGSIKVK